MIYASAISVNSHETTAYRDSDIGDVLQTTAQSYAAFNATALAVGGNARPPDLWPEIYLDVLRTIYVLLPVR